MARARVLELGLQTQVVLVEGDINSETVRKKLPKKADLVTCSYCLTMIPPWKEALATMLDLVEVGGNLALIDFVTREGREERFFAAAVQVVVRHGRRVLQPRPR